MRHVVRCEIQDTVGFLYSQSQADAIVAGYPEHERMARAKGIPQLGSGRVFPIDLDSIICEPFAIPKHFRRLNGTDFGWDHPFGAVSIAHDPDSDVIYAVHEYRRREATPIIHAAAIRTWGAWIPCAWPHDGLQHDKGSGEPLAEQYRKQQLNMLEEKATFEDGGFGLEAGIMDMLDRFYTGRLKVFRILGALLEEISYYHRVEGLIVKERDDLISALRIAIMMLRFAMTDPGTGRFDLNKPLHANVGTLA